MPRLDGVELLRTLSASHPALPIILMSGYATEHLVSAGVIAPCAVLGKPFSIDTLVGEVRRCLGGGPRRPAPRGTTSGPRRIRRS
jgi:DNA-binding NtrC family response regulator